MKYPFYMLLSLSLSLTALGQEKDKIKNKSLNYAQDTFDQVFIPLGLEYLYRLYDSHTDSHEYLDELFKVKRVIGAKNPKNKKLVSYCLFWKPSEEVSLKSIYKKISFGKKGNCFFDAYVQPMIKCVNWYLDEEKETIVRIYLAADLIFLVPKLMNRNVEIYVMASNSIGHSPGAMWRFLALSEGRAQCIVVKDSDDSLDKRRESKINQFINDKSKKGWYRFTSHNFRENLDDAIYSPIIANNFGFKPGIAVDIEKAMKGYILHRQLFPDESRHPRDKALPDRPYGAGNNFPIYGFDERFLKHVIYYDAANRGQLTTLITSKDQKDIYRGFLKSSKEYLIQKDYCYIYKFNSNPIYY